GGSAGGVAAGSVRGAARPRPAGAPRHKKHDRNGRGCSLGSKAPRRAVHGDHGYLATNQIGRKRRQPIIVALRPAVFDRQILTFDITGFLQSLAECTQKVCEELRRLAAEKPNHRYFCLLATRRDRPRCRALKYGYELAPPHGAPLGPSVTPTALARMWMPRNILSRASTENLTSMAAMLALRGLLRLRSSCHDEYCH